MQKENAVTTITDDITITHDGRFPYKGKLSKRKVVQSLEDENGLNLY